MQRKGNVGGTGTAPGRCVAQSRIEDQHEKPEKQGEEVDGIEGPLRDALRMIKEREAEEGREDGGAERAEMVADEEEEVMEEEEEEEDDDMEEEDEEEEEEEEDN